MGQPGKHDRRGDQLLRALSGGARSALGRALFIASEQRLFWCVLVVGGLVLMLDNAWLARAGWLGSVLQWVSGATTTGFQSATLTAWHPGPRV